MNQEMKCGYCEEPAETLRSPHVMGHIKTQICRNCWEVDRETHLKTWGEDIGEFQR